MSVDWEAAYHAKVTAHNNCLFLLGQAVGIACRLKEHGVGNDQDARDVDRLLAEVSHVVYGTPRKEASDD